MQWGTPPVDGHTPVKNINFWLTENASFNLHLNGDKVVADMILEFNIGTSVNSVLTIQKTGNEETMIVTVHSRWMCS